MKWNLLKRWKDRRLQKRKQKEQRNLLQTWAWLDSIFKSGMLSFDEKEHRLFIMNPLATLLMANGADAWLNSIHNIYQYIYLKQSQKAWENYFMNEEQTAVRKAMKTPAGDNMTRDDIERIKRARRAEIAASDMKPPKVEPFEFFIIPESTDAKVEPIGIGYYDPSTGEMEVASWDDVKGYINKE